MRHKLQTRIYIKRDQCKSTMVYSTTNSTKPNRNTLLGRLVIVFKNCCLKICENCGLKSVVGKRIFSVNKTKKCIWYHGLNYIFQCSKNIKYVFGMCVLNDKKADQSTK